MGWGESGTSKSSSRNSRKHPCSKYMFPSVQIVQHLYSAYWQQQQSSRNRSRRSCSKSSGCRKGTSRNSSNSYLHPKPCCCCYCCCWDLNPRFHWEHRFRPQQQQKQQQQGIEAGLLGKEGCPLFLNPICKGSNGSRRRSSTEAAVRGEEMSQAAVTQPRTKPGTAVREQGARKGLFLNPICNGSNGSRTEAAVGGEETVAHMFNPCSNLASEVFQHFYSFYLQC